MKVIAINGSPRKNGNCGRALALLGTELERSGVDIETLHIGAEPIRGCIGCASCGRRGDGKCEFADDPVNDAVARMREADGIVLASPVYFSGVAGTMKSFLDRAFYVANSAGGLFRHKAGAALVAVRRSGGSSTLDCLNHYIAYSEMVVATANYWNIVHGRLPGEVEQDGEGLHTIEVLARNLAWILKMREATQGSVEPPPKAAKVYTHFVR